MSRRHLPQRRGPIEGRWIEDQARAARLGIGSRNRRQQRPGVGMRGCREQALNRAQFDDTSGPDGAFFLGDPDTITTKLRRVSDQLGGVDRVSLQMTNPRLAHADLLRGIELLGTAVAPQVRKL